MIPLNNSKSPIHTETKGGISSQNDPEISYKEEEVKFFGFSDHDRYFAWLIQYGICDEEGNATQRVKESCNIKGFSSIPEKHPICLAVNEVINPTGKPFTILQVAKTLTAFSQSKREQIMNQRMIQWPQPITDVQISGSQAWRFLLQHSNLLIESFAKLFKPYKSETEVREWLKPLITEQKALNKRAGKEIDIRIICPNASLEHVKSLRNKIISLFKSAHLSKYCSTNKLALMTKKLAVIKDTCDGFANTYSSDQSCDHSSLIGIKLNRLEHEYFITSRPSELSNNKCIVLSLKDGSLKIDHCGFDLVQILVALTRTYIPNVDNEQALVRYCEETDLVAAHDYEKKMVETSFAAIENSQLHQLFDQASFTAVLTSLNYYPSAVQRAVSPQGKFCSAKEEAICRYLYTLIRRRISSKKEQSTASSNALFAIRFCQALWQHGKLSDSGVKNLLIWLKADGILIPEEMSPFLKVSVEALLNGLSFTTFSALLTVMTWIHQPKTFTLRCTPPVFNIELPHTLRVCANVEAALKEFTRFFLSDENTLFAKEICRQLRLPFLAKTKEYQRQICQVLKLDEAFIEQLAAPLLDHSDFFIRSIALELSAKYDGYLFAKSLVNHLPILIKKQQIDLLTNLHQKLTSDLGLPAKNPFDVCKLSDWILLFLSCRQSKMTFYAYALWKENTHLVEESVDLELLTALCKEEPRVALELLTSLFAYRPLSPKFLQQKLALIEQNYPFETLFLLESYPLIEKIVTSEVFNNKPFPPSFIDHLLSFITRLENKEQQRYLLLALLFAQNIHYSQLTAELQKPLKPFAPFLHHYQNYELRFSSKEKSQFLALFDPAAPKSIPREIKEQWVELLIWFYYPGAAPQTNKKIDLCLKNLNAYFTAATCNLVAFKEIQALLLYAAHLTEESNTCLKLNESQLLALQQINCYLHSDKAASIPLWRNFDLLLPKLPSLLQAPEKHTYALKCLFNEAMQKYPPKSALLNPLAAQDWVKLLAQTGQIDFIELASAIYYANEAACEKNGDLLLFEAFSVVDAIKATYMLSDLLKVRMSPLSSKQLMICIELLSKSYQKHSALVSDDLFSILTQIVGQNTISSNLKNRVNHSFLYFISQNEEKSADFALVCIAHSLITPEQITEALFSYLLATIENKKQISTTSLTACLKIAHYLLEKDHLLLHRFLNEVLKQQEEALAPIAAIYPQFFIDFLKELVTSSQQNTFRYQHIALLTSDALLASTPEIQSLMKACLQRALREDFAKLPPSEIGCIELLAFKNKEQLLTLPNWQPLTLKLLKYSSSKHAIDLFNLLLFKKTPLDSIQALIALSQILKSSSNMSLPVNTKTYLENSWPQCIPELIQKKAWQSAAIYLHLFSQQRSVTKEVWYFLFSTTQKNLSAQDFFYIDLIKLSSFADWQNFLSAKSKQEISKEVPSVLKKLPFFVLEKEILEKEVLDWVAFILEKSLESSLDLKEIFASNLAAFGNIALQLLQQDISVSLKKELFFGGYLPVDELKTLAQREIEAQLDLLQPDFALCIELVSLCSDPASALLLLSPHLTSLQSPFLSLFAEQLSSAGFIDEKKQVHCWLLLFGRAAQISWQEADSYLETLPSVFHQAIFADEKEQANQLLLQAAAKNFLQLKKEGSYEEELFAKSSLLKEKSADLSKITPAIYPLLFATLSATTIEKNYEKWLLALQQAFELDQTEEQELLRPEFKQNFNLLLKLKAVTHLFSEQESSKIEKPLPLTLAARSCLIAGINKKCIDEQAFTQFKRFILSFTEELTDTFCNFQIKEATPIDVYLLATPLYQCLLAISQVCDLHSTEEEPFLRAAVAMLVKLEEILSIMPTEQATELKAIEERKSALLSLMMPTTLSKLTQIYFQKLLELIEQQSTIDFASRRVKYLVIDKLIKSLFDKSLKKNKINVLFSLVKLCTEREVALIYQSLVVNQEESKKLRSILLQAVDVPIFKKCPWLLTHLLLLGARKSEVKELEILPKPLFRSAHQEALNRALAQKTTFSSLSACAIYFNHIALNSSFPEEFQVSNFQTIASLGLSDLSLKIEGKTFSRFIYDVYLQKKKKNLEETDRHLFGLILYEFYSICMDLYESTKNLTDQPLQIEIIQLAFAVAKDLKSFYFSSDEKILFYFNNLFDLQLSSRELAMDLLKKNSSSSKVSCALYYSLLDFFYQPSIETISSYLQELRDINLYILISVTYFLEFVSKNFNTTIDYSFISLLKNFQKFSLGLEKTPQQVNLDRLINHLSFKFIFSTLRQLQQTSAIEQKAKDLHLFIDLYEILLKGNFFQGKQSTALSFLEKGMPFFVQTKLFYFTQKEKLLEEEKEEERKLNRYFKFLSQVKEADPSLKEKLKPLQIQCHILDFYLQRANWEEEKIFSKAVTIFTHLNFDPAYFHLLASALGGEVEVGFGKKTAEIDALESSHLLVERMVEFFAEFMEKANNAEKLEQIKEKAAYCIGNLLTLFVHHRVFTKENFTSEQLFSALKEYFKENDLDSTLYRLAYLMFQWPHLSFSEKERDYNELEPVLTQYVATQKRTHFLTYLEKMKREMNEKT